MVSISHIIIAIVGLISLLLVIRQVRTKLDVLAAKKRDVRKSSIKPELTFYLKTSSPLDYKDGMLFVRNIGQGKALDITIDDFHHPEEKDWKFQFKDIPALDRDDEISIDFDFFVAAYKASNKYDLLWMFDPDHDHDFASKITMSYSDIDNNRYEKIITIGENKKPKTSRSKLIQSMIAQTRR